MNEEEAREILKTMKENIDKKYLKTRNSEAIETVLNLLEKKDEIIDLMVEELSKLNYLQYCNATNCNYPPCNKEKCIKQYFENKVKESK